LQPKKISLATIHATIEKNRVTTQFVTERISLAIILATGKIT
jgi:hypothetical protein